MLEPPPPPLYPTTVSRIPATSTVSKSRCGPQNHPMAASNVACGCGGVSNKGHCVSSLAKERTDAQKQKARPVLCTATKASVVPAARPRHHKENRKPFMLGTMTLSYRDETTTNHHLEVDNRQRRERENEADDCRGLKLTRTWSSSFLCDRRVEHTRFPFLNLPRINSKSYYSTTRFWGGSGTIPLPPPPLLTTTLGMVL